MVWENECSSYLRSELTSDFYKEVSGNVQGTGRNNLDRCTGSCNAHNDTSRKIYVPIKTENVNWSIFNMITEKH